MSVPQPDDLRARIQEAKRECSDLTTDHLLLQAQVVRLSEQCGRLRKWAGRLAAGSVGEAGVPAVVPLAGSLATPGTLDRRVAQLQREAVALQVRTRVCCAWLCV